MQIISALSDPTVLKRVLEHLELPPTLRQPAPARAPPWSDVELELDLNPDLDPVDDLDDWDQTAGTDLDTAAPFC